MQSVVLDEFIEQLYEESKVLAETKKIKIRFERSEPIHIHGDPARLKQLFLNLIDNAIKYTQQHGIVTLSLAKEDGFAKVTIKDTGIGIPRKDQNKIFERFYRVERKSESTLNVGGSGLGLPIAKWITEAHKGSIEVKSREGKGSTFVIRLPLA
ncbi:MAG: hypothetical protein EHJ95_05175 [Methanobacteriota archaeon]|nr:MAG: hypothetical protein EHJ95_05175 [Euryarchaeota archaeon]